LEAGVGVTFPVGLIRAWEGKHRLFGQLKAFNIISACIASSLFRFATEDRNEDGIPRMSFACSQFDREVHFPFANVIETVALDVRTFGIDFAITTKIAQKGQPTLATTALHDVLPHSIGPLFIDFFENYRGWLEETLGTDTYKWPSVWNFGRVVRNAASHGGRLSWRNDKAQAVAWHHLSYSVLKRGRQVICGDLEVGDLLLLMLEMDAELDRLGCPITVTD
jgi:hypothetical protein